MEEGKYCGLYIKHIHTTLEKRANNDLRELSLTGSQVVILSILNDAEDGKMILKDIEKKLHLAQSTVAGTVSRLEEKKLVESFDNLDDKRVKWVKITDSGTKMCEVAQNKIDESEKTLLSNLTEAEKVILITLLKKISDNIK